MNRNALNLRKPKITMVALSSIGTVQAFDGRNKMIPEYSGKYTKELRAKILEDAPEDAIFFGPADSGQWTKEEFRRRN